MVDEKRRMRLEAVVRYHLDLHFHLVTTLCQEKPQLARLRCGIYIAKVVSYFVVD